MHGNCTNGPNVRYVDRGVIILILVNTLVIATTHKDQNTLELDMHKYAEVVFTVTFTIEAVFKILALG